MLQRALSSPHIGRHAGDHTKLVHVPHHEGGDTAAAHGATHDASGSRAGEWSPGSSQARHAADVRRPTPLSTRHSASPDEVHSPSVVAAAMSVSLSRSSSPSHHRGRSPVLVGDAGMTDEGDGHAADGVLQPGDMSDSDGDILEDLGIPAQVMTVTSPDHGDGTTTTPATTRGTPRRGLTPASDAGSVATAASNHTRRSGTTIRSAHTARTDGSRLYKPSPSLRVSAVSPPPRRWSSPADATPTPTLQPAPDRLHRASQGGHGLPAPSYHPARTSAAASARSSSPPAPVKRPVRRPSDHHGAAPSAPSQRDTSPWGVDDVDADVSPSSLASHVRRRVLSEVAASLRARGSPTHTRGGDTGIDTEALAAAIAEAASHAVRDAHARFGGGSGSGSGSGGGGTAAVERSLFEAGSTRGDGDAGTPSRRHEVAGGSATTPRSAATIGSHRAVQGVGASAGQRYRQQPHHDAGGEEDASASADGHYTGAAAIEDHRQLAQATALLQQLQGVVRRRVHAW